MPREVSQFLMQCSLEAGELFGVSREDMLSRMDDPGRLERRGVWYDWEEYRTLMTHVFTHMGSGPVLVAAGQRYLNERYRTRSAHLYAQYTNWERMLWVAKTLMAGRMMKGYSIDYTEKGEDRFEVTMKIPEHLSGFPDFFYFLAGVWTGSSPQAKLQHMIHSLEVATHHAVADITFDKRSLHSRVAYNPVYSRMKSLWELWRCTRETRKVSSVLAGETENLDKAFDAVSNAVFLIRGDEIVMANANARSLLEEEAEIKKFLALDFYEFERRMDREPGGVLKVGDRVFRLRSQGLEDYGKGRECLVSLEDQTRMTDLEERMEHGVEEIRKEAEAKLEQSLGGTLDELVGLLAEVEGDAEETETRELVRSLGALARHCRRQGLALVDGEPPCFPSDEDLLEGLRDVAREFQEVFDFRVVLEGETLPSFREPQERGLFLLMVQEVLRNAWRHSGVAEARMELLKDGVRITDQGRGFQEVMEASTGLGLASIRERAELLGLRAEVVHGQAAGWRFLSQTERKGAA